MKFDDAIARLQNGDVLYRIDPYGWRIGPEGKGAPAESVHGSTVKKLFREKLLTLKKLGRGKIRRWRLKDLQSGPTGRRI